MTKTSIIIASLLLLALSGGVLAEHHGKKCDHEGHGMHHRGGGTAMLDQAVGLTDEQKVAVENVHNKYKEEMKSIGGKRKGDHWGLMALDPNDANYETKVQELAKENAKIAEQKTLLRAKKHAEVMAILTDEQKQKLKEHRKEMKSKMKKHHGGMMDS